MASAQVDLCHRVEAGYAENVDQHSDLDRVARQERDLDEEGALGDELAGQRLAEPGELRKEDAQQGLRRQLGDPAGVVEDVATRSQERAMVGRLGEANARRGQDRAEHPGHEVAFEVRRVGVEEHDDVARRNGQRSPHRVALPGGRPELGEDLVLLVNGHPVAGGDHGRPVARARVDCDQLVDERRNLVQRVDLVGDRADRRRDLAAGQDDRYPDVERALSQSEPPEVGERAAAVRAAREPVAGGGGYEAGSGELHFRLYCYRPVGAHA